MKKRTILTALVLAALTGGAPAMAAPGEYGPGCDSSRMERKEQRLERMAAVLDLSAEQKEQIRAIQEQAWAQAEPLRQQLENAREQLRATRGEAFDEAKIRELASRQADAKEELIVHRARTRSQINAVLTPEQREKAQELRELKKEHRKGARPGRR